MPRVPTYQRQVSQRPLGAPVSGARYSPALRAPQVDAANFGGAIGEGLQRVGAVGAQVAQVQARAQQEELVAKVRREEAAFDDLVTQSLYDDKTGFMHQHGENALAAEDKLYETLNKARNEAFGKLDGAAFDQYDAGTGQTLRNVKRLVEGKLAQEREALAAAADDALFGSQLELAGRAPITPIYEQAVTKGAAAKRSRAARLGLGKEEAEAEVQAWTADVAETVLKARIAAGDALGAAEWLGAHRVELGTRAQKYEGAVAEMGLAQEADRVTSVIGLASRPEGYPWIDAATAQAAVEELPAGPFKDEVRKRVEHAIKVSDNLRQRAVAEKFDEALAIYDEAETLTDKRMLPIRRWLNDPKNGGGEKWRQLENMDRADRRAERTTNAAERSAIAEERQALVKEFQGMPLEERRRPEVAKEWQARTDRLGRADIGIDHRRASEQAGKEEVRERSAYTTKRAWEIISDTTLAEKSSKGKRDEFFGKLNGWFATSVAGGKVPTEQEIDAKITDFLTYKGGIWGMFQERGFEQAEPSPTPAPGSAPPTPQAAPSAASTVPADHRERIVRAFTAKRGREPNEAEILERYRIVTGGK